MQFFLLRNSQIQKLIDRDLDLKLFEEKITIEGTFVKNCADLLVYDHIMKNVPKGSRILEIGGGNSRILPHLKHQYECWNIDKFEGAGNGPVQISKKQLGIEIVREYIGDYSPSLPNQYFDFVFSNSVLEHLPKSNEALYKAILYDTYRILRKGGSCLHCIDIFYLTNHSYREHPVVNYFREAFNQKGNTINLHQDVIRGGNDSVFYMSEEVYNKRWKKSTKRSYHQMGRPTSVQVLYSKSDLDEQSKIAGVKSKVVSFTHIPKAGGSTFIDILKTLYGKNKVIHIWPKGRFKTIHQLAKSKVKNFRVVLGHFKYGMHLLFQKDFQYVTILRNPLERAISNYYYTLKNADHRFHKQLVDDNISLDKYILEPVGPDVDNGQVRILSPSNKEIGSIDSTDLFRAKRNLKQFYTFGILEKWEETLEHFKAELHWDQIPKFEVMNTTKRASYNLSDEVLKEFNEKNKYDIELYEYAQELFEERIRNNK